MTLATRVEAAIGRGPAVKSVKLVGSRARGTAVQLSDWDFAVEAPDFDAAAAALPELVSPLEPLAQQWDPLSEQDRCYMLLLRGPTKVDLIFDLPHEPAAPWTVAPETLAAIDHHFWDWLLWLGAKQLGGRNELVRDELHKMSRHLLAPMGVEAVPESLAGAVSAYRAALEQQERRLGIAVEREVAEEVQKGLRRAGITP